MRERDFEWLESKGLPVEVLSDEEVIKSVAEFKRKNGTWIVADSDHLGGKSSVRGTRISVAHLLEMFASEMTITDIIDAYPSLSEGAVKGVLEELATEHEKSRRMRIFLDELYPCAP